MWGFGENNVYENLAIGSPRILRWQRRIQRLITFAPLLVAGRGVFSYSGGFIPHRRPITVLIGDPIHVGAALTAADLQKGGKGHGRLDEVHREYQAAVLKLFNNYKDIYDPKAQPLQFI